ncbi:MAG: putative pyridoxal kinase [Vezdaea aestivalis]|nr:MAG: putative pyridoxal kinase [Vezdaea aestivalis]
MPNNDMPPPTKVLAIASHVTYGHVGNSMVVPVMQFMGCEVSPLNTVYLSNHKAYRQTKGRSVSAEEIREIYEGLHQSYLDDFDMLLSGYVAGSKSLEAVGAIARDLKLKSATKPGSFFWVLDPVMGDEGRLYVDKDVVPVYKSLLHEADLLLPNQFELELLSDSKVDDLTSLGSAIAKLHQDHRIPHVVVTSIRFDQGSPNITVVGSTQKEDRSPRLFQLEVPAIDAFFSGAGDLFAALVSARLRAGAASAGIEGQKSWISPDNVEAVDLPLAKAVELTLGSMQGILQRTKVERDRELDSMKGILEQEEGSDKRQLLRKMKASEVRLIRNLDLLKCPDHTFVAKSIAL